MSADEFDAIAKLFAPLATHAGARGLLDDVAVIEARGKLVLTTDAIVEGVHFLADDPIDTVAKKALRVNLSDLAAKGAKPLGVLVSLLWPDARPAAQIADFARGLGEDLKVYDVALLGGDTTSTPGPLAISIAAIGEALGNETPSRGGAKVGDDIWITGPIGEAYIGLQALLGKLGDTEPWEAAIQAYRVPQPPVAFASAIALSATASIDVSDGLVQDAEKIAAASGVRLRIMAATVPVNVGGAIWSIKGKDMSALLTGGDDYQALFTAPPRQRSALARAADANGVSLVKVGTVEEGEGAEFVAFDGSILQFSSAGHRHKLGR